MALKQLSFFQLLAGAQPTFDAVGIKSFTLSYLQDFDTTPYIR